ncbi:MAG: CesD/SycD/LcrH family type III secretion system chaperone [Verrucomicrobia bacterium GWC2_42_7]|nr:MAG: CesD/SycD/LcrH family type III secretion system chaperone [Verrucomicrobia bacterium GWC2_42_7]
MNEIEIGLGEKEVNEIAEQLRLFLSGVTTYKDIMGLQDSHLETIYSMAYDFYRSNKFDKAEELFKGLCLLNPRCHKFWMGLAACVQMQKRFDKAMEVYGFAIAVEAMNPAPFLYIADCALGLKNLEGAIASLNLGCEVMESTNTHTTKHKALYDKAKQRLSVLEGLEKSKEIL